MTVLRLVKRAASIAVVGASIVFLVLALRSSWGDVEKGFKEADRVFEDTYITKHVNNAQLERRASDDPEWREHPCAGLAAAIDRVLEIRIPLACLGTDAQPRVAFLLSVTREGAELELHPRHGPIEVDVPDARFQMRTWTA